MQEGQTYAQENGLFFMETSAKTAANVNELFHEIGTCTDQENVFNLASIHSRSCFTCTFAMNIRK